MNAYIIRMSLVSGFTMNRKWGLETIFIGTKHDVQNGINLKQNFLSNFLNTFATFFIFLLESSISFTHAFKVFKGSLVSIDAWYFPWMKNGYWKFILFCHLIIPNRNERRYVFLEKRLFSNSKIFVIKSTNKTKRVI